MIFVTVGTQLPFNRLVSAVDRWAGSRERSDLFGQIGQRALTPRHFPSAASLAPEVFQQKLRDAEIIVGHAGMGTILQAMEHRKRAVLMPRDVRFGEHRSDHQFASARRLADRPALAVAYTEDALHAAIDAALAAEPLAAEAPAADSGLLLAVNGFLNEANARSPRAATRATRRPARRFGLGRGGATA